ncbi:hydrogenase maturation protease [Zoogloea sp.]|uniref:hydrogenase maturation protease n=1 Tax=Zoogloea sp. TaxID=49181 RepID=UPI0031FC96D5
MDLVIFAVGNPSRGDDALGPLLMDELERQAPPGVQLVNDFQLQPEHALDLHGRALALFIDAGAGTPAPFEFRELQAAAGHAVSSHAFTPQEVLRVYEILHGHPPPPAFLLCVRGEDFTLGEALSASAVKHLEAARRHLHACLAAPAAEHWRQQLAGTQGKTEALR